jgi:hypothetical protein
VTALTWAALAQAPKRIDNHALKTPAKNGDEWVTYGRECRPRRRTRGARLPLRRAWSKGKVMIGNGGAE